MFSVLYYYYSPVILLKTMLLCEALGRLQGGVKLVLEVLLVGCRCLEAAFRNRSQKATVVLSGGLEETAVAVQI